MGELLGYCKYYILFERPENSQILVSTGSPGSNLSRIPRDNCTVTYLFTPFRMVKIGNSGMVGCCEDVEQQEPLNTAGESENAAAAITHFLAVSCKVKPVLTLQSISSTHWY
jgi:hypothetical protein